MITVGELMENLGQYPSDQQVQVTVKRDCECGHPLTHTASEIKVSRYYFMPRKDYPNDYWVQLTVEVEGP
jgi:hypothetical protein